MRRMLTTGLVGVMCLAFLGCGPQRETVSLDQLCVEGEFLSPDSRVSLRAGVPLRLVAVHEGATCRPSCDTVVTRRCAFTREANTFHLRSEVVVDVDCRGESPPPDCQVHLSTCVTDPLPAGEYVVTDGTRSLTFRVPSVVPTRRNCTPRGW